MSQQEIALLEDSSPVYNPPTNYMSLETAITQATLFKTRLYKLPTENSRDSFEKKVTDEKFFIDNKLKDAASLKTSILILINTSLGGSINHKNKILLINKVIKFNFKIKLG